MATTNLSNYNKSSVPSAESMKFGIIVAEWNQEITSALVDGAVQTLVDNGARRENIDVKWVPGTFELTLGAQHFATYTDVDAVIALGVVIQGETRHFDFICQGVTHGITELNLRYSLPFIFGVLTTENLQQAQDRSGGKHGNKGCEAAVTAIKMVALQKDFADTPTIQMEDLDDDLYNDLLPDLE